MPAKLLKTITCIFFCTMSLCLFTKNNLFAIKPIIKKVNWPQCSPVSSSNNLREILKLNSSQLISSIDLDEQKLGELKKYCRHHTLPYDHNTLYMQLVSQNLKRKSQFLWSTMWQKNNWLYNIIKLRSKLTKVILIIRMLHYFPPHLLWTGQLPYWTVTSSIATSPSSVLALIKIWGAKFH